MLRCTEVSQQTDEMGQKRYFRAEPHVRLRQERTSRPDSGWCRTGRLHGWHLWPVTSLSPRPAFVLMAELPVDHGISRARGRKRVTVLW